jgi:cobalamin biosynthesis Mg chelatase CobN
MRPSPQVVLILSAIAAVEAARGSKCRHGHPKNGNVTPAISSVPSSVTSEAASESLSGVVSPSEESFETSQMQNGVSTVSIIPTEAVKVPEPANDAKHVKIQETVTSSKKLAALSTPQSEVATKSKATGAALKEPTKKFCGKPNESEVLFGTPWIVFSMNYNYQSIKGSSCVGYYDYTGSGDDQTIHWSVLWNIDPDVGTNLVKGYNFIGLTQGLETRLSDIKSIPSKYEWTTSKTTEYKGG